MYQTPPFFQFCIATIEGDEKHWIKNAIKDKGHVNTSNLLCYEAELTPISKS